MRRSENPVDSEPQARTTHSLLNKWLLTGMTQVPVDYDDRSIVVVVVVLCRCWGGSPDIAGERSSWLT